MTVTTYAPPRRQTDWTDENIARLRELWASGLSTRLIGLDMGISKNAVIGKANRLRLPPRPTPIDKVKPQPRVVMRLPAEAKVSA